MRVRGGGKEREKEIVGEQVREGDEHDENYSKQ